MVCSQYFLFCPSAFMFLIRGSKEPCHGNNADRMKTSSSPQLAEPSSSLVSTSAQHHHCIKAKKLVLLILRSYLCIYDSFLFKS